MKNNADGTKFPGRTHPAGEPPPASWVGTLWGMALFLVTGAYSILEEIPVDWIEPERITFRPALMLAILLLPPFGVALGWIRNFPRWSYAYGGLSLFAGMYMMNASSPGFTLFGIPLFGRELWGWRAFVPLLLAVGMGLLVTRSFRPLIVLFARIARDLTLVTYAMFGFLPLLVWLSFDEIDRLYSLPWMVTQALLAVCVAWFYLRSRSPRGRVVSISVGVLLSLAIMAVGPALYQKGWVDVPLMIFWVISIAIFMLLPSFFSLAQPSANIGKV